MKTSFNWLFMHDIVSMCSRVCWKSPTPGNRRPSSREQTAEVPTSRRRGRWAQSGTELNLMPDVLMCRLLCIYNHTHTHVHTHIYIHILPVCIYKEMYVYKDKCPSHSLACILDLWQANTVFLEFCTSKTCQTTQQASVPRVHIALRQACGALANSSVFFHGCVHVAGSELAQAGQLYHIAIARHRLIRNQHHTKNSREPTACGKRDEALNSPLS